MEKRRFVNEEFLEVKSIKPCVSFTFGGYPMVIAALDFGAGRYKIYKRVSGSPEYGFGFGYNPESKRAQIGWEKGHPEDIDIRIAADVMVSKMIYLLLEHKFDMTQLPRLK